MGSFSVQPAEMFPPLNERVNGEVTVIMEELHSENLPNKDPSFEFWISYLGTVEPCILTRLKPGIAPSTPSTLRSVRVNLDGISARSDDFCKSTNIALATVLKVAWGMVLRTYTGSDSVCFGYRNTGRNMSVDGVEGTIRPFVNILPCAMRFEGETTLLDAVHKAEWDSIRALPYQHVSLAKIYHGSDALFNTSMIFWHSERSSDGPIPKALSPRLTETEGPTEVRRPTPLARVHCVTVDTLQELTGDSTISLSTWVPRRNASSRITTTFCRTSRPVILPVR